MFAQLSNPGSAEPKTEESNQLISQIISLMGSVSAKDKMPQKEIDGLMKKLQTQPKEKGSEEDSLRSLLFIIKTYWDSQSSAEKDRK